MQLHRLRLLLVRLLALALVQAAHGDPPAKSRQPSISTEPARTDRYSDPLPAGVVARLGTVRLRHSACFAFAPDGKTLATAERQTIRLWELATGKELSRWPTRIDGIRFLLFSPDGRRLAALEALGLEAEILDLHRKQPQFHLRVPRRGGGYILRTARMAFLRTAKSCMRATTRPSTAGMQRPARKFRRSDTPRKKNAASIRLSCLRTARRLPQPGIWTGLFACGIRRAGSCCTS